MSLYNAVCGNNPLFALYLKMLGIDLDSIPRFRDVYIDVEKNAIVIYTRTGGANRDNFQEQNNYLTKHPLYIDDHDDSFDGTFAHFLFKIPDIYKQKVIDIQRVLGKMYKFKSPREKYLIFMEEMTNNQRALGKEDETVSEEEAETVSSLISEIISTLE